MINLLISIASAGTASTVTGGTIDVGTLDPRLLTELSGLAYSPAVDRIYTINDSGDSSRFFVSKPDGSALQQVAVSASIPVDTEDISVGPCGTVRCVYIGDIGDNNVNRQSVRLVIVPELAAYGATVGPSKVLTMRYSDGHAHNAEALAVHPSGDMFILSKVSQDPHVYKVAASVLTDSIDGATVIANDIGTIDISALFPPTVDETVTGLSISEDGRRFALITGTDAYEFAFDLSYWQTAWTSQLLEVDRTRYVVRRLPQQEAITYGPAGGLVYSTELAGGSTVPLVRIPNVVSVPPPAGKPALQAPPTISGTPTVGSTLTVSTGAWTGTQPITYVYRWRRCEATVDKCVNLPSRTAAYTVLAADLYKRLRVRVTASNADGQVPSASPFVTIVAEPPPPVGFPLGTVCNDSGTVRKPPNTYKHVIVIMLENHNLGDLAGNPQAPYWTSLRNQCGSSSQYLDNLFPWDINSLSHYLAITSGSNCNTGIGSSGTGCVTDDNGPGSHRLSTRSIFNLVTSKSYQEDMPRACDWGNPSSGTKYWVKHNPEPYYTQAAECGAHNIGIARVSCQSTVNATCNSPNNALVADLANDTLPAYAFVTPDILNDIHDAGVSVGDNWLHTYLPLIFASPAYLRGEVALWVLFDEDGGGGGHPIPNLMISPYVSPRTSNMVMNHFAALRAIELQLGLTEFLGCSSGIAPGGGSCPAGSTVDIRAELGW